MDSEKERFIERLFKDEHKKLLVASQHMIGDYEEAEDLVQDVFALATLHCDKLMNHPKPAAWLMLTLMSTEQPPFFLLPPKHPATRQKPAEGRTESYADSAPEPTWRSHARRCPAALLLPVPCRISVSRG